MSWVCYGVLPYQCYNAVFIDTLLVVYKFTVFLIQHCFWDQELSYWCTEHIKLSYIHLWENSSWDFRTKTKFDCLCFEWKALPKVLYVLHDAAQLSLLKLHAYDETNMCSYPKKYTLSTAGVLLSRREERKGEDKMIIVETEKAMGLISTLIMHNGPLSPLSCPKPWLLIRKLFFFDGQGIMCSINKII